MIKITYNNAVKIQHAQMVYYRQSIGRSGVKEMRKRSSCGPSVNPEEPLSLFDINKMVPRGGYFETLIRHRPLTYDHLSIAWHNAIREDKVYSS